MKKGLPLFLALILFTGLAFFYLYRDAGLPRGAENLLQQPQRKVGLRPENPAPQLPLPPHPLGRAGTAGKAPATPADGAQAAAAWEQFLAKKPGIEQPVVVIWHNRIYIAVPELTPESEQEIRKIVKEQEPGWQEVIITSSPENRARLQKIAAAIRQGRMAADFASELNQIKS
ncbi:YhcN/YlaJ family sporulation lipoprotein [Carboxydocella sp. ULO1]|uniref:YhcN/YlaJ family sporulation lipoprotein n=1 Tax=Carboxydocella sp. ULO1 TaxID=1926599 RepID=UPI0009AC3118|nr:YhcN/YlaJ family sporulation lipoprotein [Carboxydocella sp. ULO1]GAW28391.1 hypothetical protein ULO1_09610 [Carboxydocella sp. ULO1]